MNWRGQTFVAEVDIHREGCHFFCCSLGWEGVAADEAETKKEKKDGAAQKQNEGGEREGEESRGGGLWRTEKK